VDGVVVLYDRFLSLEIKVFPVQTWLLKHVELVDWGLLQQGKEKRYTRYVLIFVRSEGQKFVETSLFAHRILNGVSAFLRHVQAFE